MLTPLQFKDIFYSNYNRFVNHELASLSDEELLVAEVARETFEDIDEHSSLTNDQWANLVKVCSMIKASTWRFKMRYWHDVNQHNPETNECGTTHCIAGWSVALMANDIDTESFPNLAKVREYISPYVSPFFWLSFTPYGSRENPEDILMEILIDPILAEAKKGSVEISQEFQKFLNKTPCVLK